MKKIAKLLSLCLVLALLISGCGNEGNNSTQGGNSSINDNNGNADSDDNEENIPPAEADFVEKDSEMFSNRDSKTDYKEKGSITIELKGNSATCNSKAVQIDGSIVTIKDEGTYILSGALEDGMIIVDAQDSDKPQLVFDNVTINSNTSAALHILEADKVFITLAEGTTNILSNGGSFSQSNNTTSSNIDGTVFSKQDLTFNGSGSLTVTSPAGHGIVCKDDLVFTSGTYTITSSSHGIDANDSFRMKNASITIEAGKDGVHVENSDDAEKGFVYITSGILSIEAEGDGISSSYYTQIQGGTIDILTGGGYENGKQHSSDNWGDFGGGMGKPGGKPPSGGAPGGTPPSGGRPGSRPNASSSGTTNNTTTTDEASTSMKGIKSNSSILLNGGTFTIDSADDGIHSNLSAYINDGTFTIASGDDAIHAEEKLTITGGKINITQSYEGLEALDITVSGGDVDILSTDDGINVAGGTDASGTGGRDEMFGGRPGGMPVGNGSMIISGGDIFMYAKGDGIDANGTVEITGGQTIVTGPTQGDTAVLDYDKTASISGGVFIGVGSTMMAQTFTEGTQGSLAAQGSFAGGTKIRIEDSTGKEIISYTPENDFQYIVISTPNIEKGQSYTMYVGSVSNTFEAD